MIYRMDLRDNRHPDAPEIPGLTFRRITCWQELRPEDLKRLERDKDMLRWGEFNWLEKGYGLWIAEIDGRLAATKWWRSAEQAKDFFIPVPEGTELHWQTVVMPEFRGRRLLEIVLHSVMEYRASEGVEAFLVSCRDFNITSRRTFARMGWTYLGYAETLKLTGATRWHPAPHPIPASELEGLL